VLFPSFGQFVSISLDLVDFESTVFLVQSRADYEGFVVPVWFLGFGVSVFLDQILTWKLLCTTVAVIA
jgi:hypothetical protein